MTDGQTSIPKDRTPGLPGSDENTVSTIQTLFRAVSQFSSQSFLLLWRRGWIEHPPGYQKTTEVFLTRLFILPLSGNNKEKQLLMERQHQCKIKPTSARAVKWLNRYHCRQVLAGELKKTCPCGVQNNPVPQKCQKIHSLHLWTLWISDPFSVNDKFGWSDWTGIYIWLLNNTLLSADLALPMSQIPLICY